MNEIVNKFLLAGDKFMPEMYLRKPGFTYSACGPFTKNKEIQKRYIYQNELDKTCFQHSMTYGYFKDIGRRTAYDKVFCNKAFNIAKNPKYDGYQQGLASMVYKFFDKETSGSSIKNENTSSNELAQELHKPITRKFEKKKSTITFY